MSFYRGDSTMEHFKFKKGLREQRKTMMRFAITKKQEGNSSPTLQLRKMMMRMPLCRSTELHMQWNQTFTDISSHVSIIGGKQGDMILDSSVRVSKKSRLQSINISNYWLLYNHFLIKTTQVHTMPYKCNKYWRGDNKEFHNFSMKGTL